MNNINLKQTLINEAKELGTYIIEKRRHIHMFPETSYEEEKTATFIEDELHKIGYTTQRTAKTGVLAILKGTMEGKTVALRADIDALNITEENDVPYKSKNPGKMHACGHDAHVAMLLGAAKILFKYKDHLQGTVKLVFQPAEEGGGGGKKIAEEGHVDDVDVIFGIHVWHELPTGVIGTRKGAMMASADDFAITIKGKGGHAAAPHQSIDPTAVLADIYNALQKLISREIDPFANVVLTSPMFEGSDAFNVIPPQAMLKGTFRTMDPEVRDHIIKRMKEIVEGYTKAWRCEGNVELGIVAAYPPVLNDPQTVDELTEILQELDTVTTMEPTMGGEDFAFYLEKTKGAFMGLGIYNEEKGITSPHHHPKFDVDESILWKGTAIHALLGFYSSLISF
ncbi:MAG: amidohydrolase [Candidatus Heimdallarchaeota archaeon]|nr:MAG: amidohydrolase [Candidatus Heimdallarchaeota archaeon]